MVPFPLLQTLVWILFNSTREVGGCHDHFSFSGSFQQNFLSTIHCCGPDCYKFFLVFCLLLSFLYSIHAFIPQVNKSTNHPSFTHTHYILHSSIPLSICPLTTHLFYSLILHLFIYLSILIHLCIQPSSIHALIQLSTLLSIPSLYFPPFIHPPYCPTIHAPIKSFTHPFILSLCLSPPIRPPYCPIIHALIQSSTHPFILSLCLPSLIHRSHCSTIHALNSPSPHPAIRTSIHSIHPSINLPTTSTMYLDNIQAYTMTPCAAQTPNTWTTLSC